METALIALVWILVVIFATVAVAFVTAAIKLARGK